MPEPPRITVCGDSDYEEFEFVFERSGYAMERTSVESLLGVDRGDFDLLVLCQKIRNSQNADSSIRLAEKYPLVSKVLLLGSDCEGETRSGKPVDLWYRRFWYQWEACLASFVTGFVTDERGGLVNLPATSSPSDHLLAMSDSLIVETRLGRLKPSQRLAVVCRWKSEWDWIADLFSTMNDQVERVDSTEIKDEDCVLLVGDSLDSEMVENLKRVQAGNPKRTVLVTNFPRLQEYRMACDLGVDQVVAKPFLNHDLIEAIWPEPIRFPCLKA